MRLRLAFVFRLNHKQMMLKMTMKLLIDNNKKNHEIKQSLSWKYVAIWFINITFFSG
jgi:hypothetical protein